MQYIKKLVPAYTEFLRNKDAKTPEEIFVEDHKELVEESNESLKSTTESCSVVATLIAGVAFATSSSIPGGTDDRSGKPILEGRLGFNIFALASLFALGFSIAAIITFLAVRTSRYQPRDFPRYLPSMFLLGFTSLFLSIASTLVSFSASFSFLLSGNLHQAKAIFPLYFLTFLPVTCYAFAVLPLYIDLLKAIYTRTPLPSNRESKNLTSL